MRNSAIRTTGVYNEMNNTLRDVKNCNNKKK